MRFHADQDGVIDGVRFYKGPQTSACTPAACGERTAAPGQRHLQRESSTGWQTVDFSSPVPVTAGTTYVASYHTSTGHYSMTAGQFTGQASMPRRCTPGPTGASAPNGVFSYGGGGFPSSDGGGTSYLVDVVYNPNPDVTPPTVADTTPEPGTTNVNTAGPVVATLSEPIQSGTRDDDADRAVGGRGRNGFLRRRAPRPSPSLRRRPWIRPPSTRRR